LFSLIGFQKSGKTTLGQMLAQELSMNGIDTDKLLEEKFQLPIKTIYQNLGEKAFRDYEAQLIREICTKDTIVSTGGGVVLNDANVLHLKSYGPLIYLKISYETYMLRQKELPLFMQGHQARYFFEHRASLYEKNADLIIDIKNDSIEESFKKLLMVCHGE